MDKDRWTFPMMIVMPNKCETEAFLRFRDAALVTLRVAAYPPTPMEVVAEAQEKGEAVLDRWCEENSDVGAVGLMIIKYIGDMEEHQTISEMPGSAFVKTMPLALPIVGPEIVFRLRNTREESRVVHLIAGLMAL